MRARPLLLAGLAAALAVPTIAYAGFRGDGSPRAGSAPDPIGCSSSSPCLESGAPPGATATSGSAGGGLDPVAVPPRVSGTSASTSRPGPTPSPAAGATGSPTPATSTPGGARSTPRPPVRAVLPAVAGAARPVPLDRIADNDGLGQTDDPDSGFDGSGNTYPRDEVPTGLSTIGGVPFTLLGDGDDNVVARGQTIELPDGRFGALRLLTAASYGPAGGTATVRYADGSAGTARVLAPDWVAGGPGALRSQSRLERGDEEDTDVHMYVVSVPLDPTRTVSSVTLPATRRPVEGAPSMHVFALTLTPTR